MQTSSSRRESVGIVLTLLNGTVLPCRMNCGMTADLTHAVNRDGLFIEIVDGEGRTRFIAKSTIAELSAAA